jgi:hypothetical protein
MPRVPGGEPLSLEHVTQVGSAAGALNLRTLTVRVGHATNGPRNLLIEGGPATVRVELVLRTVERRAAPLAFVRPGFEVAFILARKRRFRTLPDDHAFFGPGERTQDRRLRLRHSGSNGEAY